MSIRTAIAAWWQWQKIPRCHDHGHQLHFRLPLVGLGDGIQHGEAGCHPGGIQIGGIYPRAHGELVAVVEVRGAECLVAPLHAPDGYTEYIPAGWLGPQVGTVNAIGEWLFTEYRR